MYVKREKRPSVKIVSSMFHQYERFLLQRAFAPSIPHSPTILNYGQTVGRQLRLQERWVDYARRAQQLQIQHYAMGRGVRQVTTDQCGIQWRAKYTLVDFKIRDHI